MTNCFSRGLHASTSEPPLRLKARGCVETLVSFKLNGLCSIYSRSTPKLETLRNNARTRF